MSEAIDKIDLMDVFARLETPWAPEVLAEVSGHEVRAVRLEGEFVWHSHAKEDELFFVVQGEMELQFRDRIVVLGAGEMCKVPAGVEHRPVARGVCFVLLFEPGAVRPRGD